MAPFQGLAPKRLREIRRQALFGDFERINRVMTGKRIVIKDETFSGVLAYSMKDGTIVLSSKLVGDIDTEDGIICLIGANYHEVCHQMDSFGVISEEVQLEAKGELGDLGYHVWNMLEDQRIERLFLKKWKPTASYFVALVMKWLLGSDEEKWKDLYPLLMGRSYLDQSILDKLRVRYAEAHGEDKAMTIQRAVQRYVDLGWMDDPQKKPVALACIRDVYKVMYGDPNVMDILMALPFHSAAEGAAGQQGGNSTATGSGQPSDDATGSGEGDATDKDSTGDTGAGDDSGDGSGLPGSGGAPGSGTGENADDGLRKEAEQTMSRALSDDLLRQEVSNRMATVRSRAVLKERQNLPLGYPGSMEAPASAVAVMRRTANVFRQLVLEEDPGTLTHQSFGKVNMRRAMHGTDYDTAFDRWAPGQQDSTDMEVVILVDQSNSMKGLELSVSSALWSIQRAIESVSTTSTVTAIGFGSRNEYLAPRGKRVSRNRMHMVHARGTATQPYRALEEAEYIFATSRHTKGVLLILTDGVWHDSGAGESNGWLTLRCDEVIHRLNAAGITTALAFLITDSSVEYIQRVERTNSVKVDLRHEAAVFTDIAEPAELVTFAKRVVSQVIKKGVR